jgi:hypothetical protein
VLGLQVAAQEPKSGGADVVQDVAEVVSSFVKARPRENQISIDGRQSQVSLTMHYLAKQLPLHRDILILDGHLRETFVVQSSPSNGSEPALCPGVEFPVSWHVARDRHEAGTPALLRQELQRCLVTVELLVSEAAE